MRATDTIIATVILFSVGGGLFWRSQTRASEDYGRSPESGSAKVGAVGASPRVAAAGVTENARRSQSRPNDVSKPGVERPREPQRPSRIRALLPNVVLHEHLLNGSKDDFIHLLEEYIDRSGTLTAVRVLELLPIESECWETWPDGLRAILDADPSQLLSDAIGLPMEQDLEDAWEGTGQLLSDALEWHALRRHLSYYSKSDSPASWEEYFAPELIWATSRELDRRGIASESWVEAMESLGQARTLFADAAYLDPRFEQLETRITRVERSQAGFRALAAITRLYEAEKGVWLRELMRRDPRLWFYAVSSQAVLVAEMSGYDGD